jgi:Tol biopolymer transport system component
MRTLRSIPAALLVVLTGTSALTAQQTPGRVFNPLPNPANANLVAFERLDGDRRELHFLSVSTGQVSSLTTAAAAAKDVFSLPDLPTQKLSAFSGDLDWLPAAVDGRYWFAYVASDDQGVHLRLGSVDAVGRAAAGEPLRVPFPGNARSPRWAPNAKTLAFVSDSGRLYTIANVDQALRSGDASRLRPVAVGTSGTVLFPEWSPTGDHIAYQAEKNVNGARKFMIDVVPIDQNTGTARGPATTVSDALQGDNQYRPSWSPGNGANIAFYVDRASRGGPESQVLDIAVVAPQRDRGGVVRGAELRKGGSPRIAESVIPSGARGPAWTRIADGTAIQPAIVYVQKDEANNNPIVIAGVERWASMVARPQYTRA